MIVENADPGGGVGRAGWGGGKRAVGGDRVVAGGKDPLHSKTGRRRLGWLWLCCIGLNLLGNEHLAAGVDRIAEMEERGGSRQRIFGSDDDLFGAGRIGKKL